MTTRYPAGIPPTGIQYERDKVQAFMRYVIRHHKGAEPSRTARHAIHRIILWGRFPGFVGIESQRLTMAHDVAAAARLSTGEETRARASHLLLSMALAP